MKRAEFELDFLKKINPEIEREIQMAIQYKAEIEKEKRTVEFKKEYDRGISM